MRFVTYTSPSGGDRVGLVDGDQVRGLEPGVTLLDLLDADELAGAGQRAARSPSEAVPLAGLTLQAPLQPRSLRDGLGFLQHLRNAMNTPELDPVWSEIPAFYFSNVAAVVGPQVDVAISPGSAQFDYELEIAAVIGKAGSSIPRDRAEEHIAGYLLLCDWSARDLQMREMAMMLGPTKGKDGANTLGPMLVTPDELEPFRSGIAFDLAMTGYVNGEKVTDGNWNQIDWGFADMITYASRGTHLHPGDVLGSGTVPGGCLLEHARQNPEGFRGWLQPGDEVRLVVEHLGELTQRVVAGPAVEPLSTGH